MLKKAYEKTVVAFLEAAAIMSRPRLTEALPVRADLSSRPFRREDTIAEKPMLRRQEGY